MLVSEYKAVTMSVDLSFVHFGSENTHLADVRSSLEENEELLHMYMAVRWADGALKGKGVCWVFGECVYPLLHLF
jgi:hypothetical protein